MQKKYFKFQLAKWRQKHGLFVFFKYSLNLKLMLCNRNLAKLVYPTLLRNCRAWAKKLSEHLKKEEEKIHQNRAKKAIY